MKPVSLSIFLLAIMGFGCQSPDWKDAIPQAVSSESWALSSLGWTDPTVLQLDVGENELRVLGRNTLIRLDAHENAIEASIRSYHDIDLFSRPVFSHQFFLYKHSQRNNYFLMEPTDWTMEINSNRPVGVRLYSVNDPPPDDTSYAAFLNGTESGAVNAWGEFLVASIKKSTPGQVTLFLLDPYRWFPYDGRFTNARQWEVTLPAEAGTQMVRLTGLDDDFLVSTELATFLLRRDGSLAKLWDTRTTHAFVLENGWYAEAGGDLRHSTDKGASWQISGPGAGRLGAGEYFVVDTTLLFARKDSLYHVDVRSGALKPLSNHGLSGNQITAVAGFTDQVYVATLTGLFQKSRHALLR
ncbi:MAG: hypothetical protein NWR72_05605 [Bacteroidia bacterium]|nr:hypothetical protein [Bacteroidia bacterium]